MPPMTVETEPLDVAAATEAATATEETTLKIHDGSDGGDAADAIDAIDVADEPAAEATAEIVAVDYDDALTSVAVEQAEAAATNETATTNTATPVAVQTTKPAARSSDASETLAKISEAAEEVREWREKLALLKDEAKEAKENLQGAINRLMRLSSEVANDAARPLLAAAEAKAEETKPNETCARTYKGDPVDPLADAATPATPTPAAAAAEPLPSPSTEAWRSYRFDDPDHFPALASQKAIVAKLAEAGIETIGGMIEFQKPGEGGYCKTLTEIKGIGSGKAEKIENALEEFWAEHPELVQSAVDAS